MRLTNEIRKIIIKAAMHKAFDARDKAHEKASTALADAAYQHEYGAIGKIAAKLPENWCCRDNYIKIEAAGFSWHGDSLARDSLRMSKTRPMPNYQYSNPVKIGGAHPLNDKAQAVADEYQAIQRDKDELRAKLNALVYSVTTTEKLLEAWPECEAFIPARVPTTRALVPVELVPELNAAIGIKAKRKEA
ncbi:Nmad5 family putative nucleotide modification protein [Microvirga sp. 17 mud 1-3]|uniref:Nmad5 family putative nucleotide modification protein n=1 Tax=Microvirga sp. 17 mud 1-3 TaxID=2082949 RepID=UPI000D6C39F9|nr:Nmad5 family putative nucleotide modification protein [Microvirga sp. 17 mud 1-3]AWM87358.1 hypothetical protein C4E04_11850 [Microvirga sp. 17 mud 1-3]